MSIKQKVMVIIRDGWGYSTSEYGNAVLHANVPNNDAYLKNYPVTTLTPYGNAVGIPEGAMGGSEVGHLTIGAGRIVWQPYELINQKIKDGSFFTNKALLDAISHCKRHNSNLHIDGLFTQEGIHADYRQMLAILELCKRENFNRVFVHLSLDGRDMPEKSALPLLTEAEKRMKEIGVGTMVSVIGRYYSMDRDNNWDRTMKAYELIVGGKADFTATSAREAIEKAYARGDKTDYYVQATAIVGKDKKPLAVLKEHDSFIWYNFRSDRARQITLALNGCPEVSGSEVKPVNVHYVCFTVYDSNWTFPVAFPQEKVKNNLGSVISQNGLKQLRIAETEKYPHVTFFFNSQEDNPYPGEKRIMVNSPKVPSYDLQPEMSAYEVTEKLLAEIGAHEFILVNYANPDLVGHSGVFEAVVKACEVVDECVGNVVDKALAQGYTIILMADHGNAETMLYPDGKVNPSHGLNKIQMILISKDPLLQKAKLHQDQGLKDIAPTVLKLMGIAQPKEMTGIPLF